MIAVCWCSVIMWQIMFGVATICSMWPNTLYILPFIQASSGSPQDILSELELLYPPIPWWQDATGTQCEGPWHPGLGLHDGRM